MKIYYHDHFVLPLPEGHRFPMAKYRLLRERVVAAKLVDPADLQVADGATDSEILRAHSAEYLHKVKNGLLTKKEIRRIGFPWSPELVERSRRSAGSTVAACRAALTGDIGVNLAGGTHHAHRDWGEGYCVFNDAVIAARSMQAEGKVRRVAVIDCDVHQGNGTAALTAGDASIFTFSIHGEKNFPYRKCAGDLDIGLPDGTTDESYLEALEHSLWRVFTRGRPELVIYLSGADAFAGDRLGRLALTKDGLAARDQMVMGACLDAGVPFAVAMAGGYAVDVADTADIHFNTVRLAASLL
ncbi:MAG: histone deacetylase [Anaerolineae bacterium]|nr:histone deacetylase [Anaerolineae bacterium]